MTFPVRVLMTVFLLLISSACAGGSALPTPTLPPRATTTPISTALPDVATDVPAGFAENNPLQLVIVAADSEAAQPLTEQLAAELSERSGLAVSVVLAASQAEATGLLCGSDQGIVSAVWVSGITAAVSTSSGCGVPVLQFNAGTEEEPDTGSSGILLINTELASTGAEAIPGRTFCRTTYTDFYSWTVPLLLLRSEGIDITQLEDIDEFDSYEELAQAIAAGDCAAGGMPSERWEELQAEDDTLTETVTVLAQSLSFPYAMLVFPFEASLDVINPVVGALLEMDYVFGRAEEPAVEVTAEPESTAEATAQVTEEATPAPEATESGEDSEQVGLLVPFFGDGIFQRVSDEDFSALITFLRETGIDFSQLSE